MKKHKITLLIVIFLIIWCFINLLLINNNASLKEYDAITVFFYTLAFSNLSILQIIAPIFVIIAAIWNFHNELHTGSIKNCLTRMNYKKYIRKQYFIAVSKACILPIVMVLFFLGCFLITKNFDFTKAIPKVIGSTAIDGLPILSGTLSPIYTPFYDQPIQLMVTFFLVLFLHSVVYVNIGFIMCKKNKNKIVTLIASFLGFIALNILSEIVISSIVNNLFEIETLFGIFNLFGIWVYCDFTQLLPVIVYALILVVISSLIAFFTYKNQEGVIIEIEK